MSDLKITIDQLKNYLGTRLKCEHPTTKGHYWKLSHDDMILNTISIKVALEIGAKPICYRLSDLDKYIPELGFVPIEKLEVDSCSVEYCDIAKAIKVFPDHCEWIYPIDIYHNISQELFKMHFWPFGDEYFTEGLVIDKLKNDE